MEANNNYDPHKEYMRILGEFILTALIFCCIGIWIAIISGLCH